MLMKKNVTYGFYFPHCRKYKTWICTLGEIKEMIIYIGLSCASTNSFLTIAIGLVDILLSIDKVNVQELTKTYNNNTHGLVPLNHKHFSHCTNIVTNSWISRSGEVHLDQLQSVKVMASLLALPGGPYKIKHIKNTLIGIQWNLKNYLHIQHRYVKMSLLIKMSHICISIKKYIFLINYNKDRRFFQTV